MYQSNASKSKTISSEISLAPGHAVVATSHSRPSSPQPNQEALNPYRRPRPNIIENWQKLHPILREVLVLSIMLIGGIMLQAPRGIETLYLIPIMRATKSNGRLGGAVVAMFALLILGTADTVGMHQFSLASLGFMELFRVVAYAFAILLVESMVDRITATENLAVTDPLTGVFNRLGFASQVQSIISRAMMARKQVTLVLIDLDDFKTLNDQHGHQFGDEILKALVQSLEPALANRNGVLGRTGGDEFQMLFVDISREDITRALLRAAARFSDQTLVLGHRSTFSFGIAESDMVGYLVTHLTEAADAEMYHRKSSKTFGHMA